MIDRGEELDAALYADDTAYGGGYCNDDSENDAPR